MVTTQKVLVYVDKFGKRHETLKEAERSEAFNDLKSAAEEAAAYGVIEAAELPTFIDENAELILRYLNSSPLRK